MVKEALDVAYNLTQLRKKSEYVKAIELRCLTVTPFEWSNRNETFPRRVQNIPFQPTQSNLFGTLKNQLASYYFNYSSDLRDAPCNFVPSYGKKLNTLWNAYQARKYVNKFRIVKHIHFSIRVGTPLSDSRKYVCKWRITYL